MRDAMSDTPEIILRTKLRPSRGPVGSVPSASLGVQVQVQQQTQWCWAASTTSIAEFYRRGTGWSQCLLAAQEFGADCCKSPSGCNRPWYPDRALRRTRNYDSERSGAAAFSEIVEHVGARRLIDIQIEWPPVNGKKSGHMVLACGYSSGRLVHVGDVGDGSTRTVLYDDLVNKYMGVGRWVHTFYTRSA